MQSDKLLSTYFSHCSLFDFNPFINLSTPLPNVPPRRNIIPNKFQKDLGLSILLVEQNAKLAFDLSDYVYVLELGRVAMSGSKENVQNSRDIQEFYLGMHQDSQLGKKRWKNRKTWR